MKKLLASAIVITPILFMSGCVVTTSTTNVTPVYKKDYVYSPGWVDRYNAGYDWSDNYWDRPGYWGGPYRAGWRGRRW